jgi:peptidoglycan/LPS O-acetylase OafA/YrhL
MVVERVRHRHLPELQALRGIAASVVLLHHSSFFLPLNKNVKFLFESIFNAHAAVVTFFILSGYVLTLSLKYKINNMGNILLFYKSRLFRIYPALWLSTAVIVIFAISGFRNGSNINASEWFIRLNSSNFNIFRVASLSLGYPSSLLPPSWSISVELLASILVPFIAFSLNGKTLRWFLITVIMFFTAILFQKTPVVPYIWVFSLGAGVNIFSPILSQSSSRVRSALAISALVVLLFFRLLSPAWRFDVDYGAFAPLAVEAVSGTILLAAIVAQAPAMNFLKQKLLVFTGDISYSMYLLHWPIMGVIGTIISNLFQKNADGYYGMTTAVSLMLSVLFTTIIFGYLSYRFIELPGIALGKRKFMFSRQKA